MVLPPWLARWSNPNNLTRLHLAHGIRRHGWTIGATSYGAPRVRFPAEGEALSIGDYCSIADGVEIILAGNHRRDFVSTYPFSALLRQWPEAADLPVNAVGKGGVHIGSDVWIGSGALILSGVRIGHGAIVAARAVVARDVAPYAIAAGNPAHMIGKRFDDERIACLLATRWWELPRTALVPLLPLIASADVDGFLSALGAQKRS